MRIRSIAFLLALVAAAACGDSPTDTTPAETRFSFEYRMGTETTWRTFDSRGLLPSGTPSPAEGVIVSPEGGQVFVLARSQLLTYGTRLPVLERGTTVDIVPSGTPCSAGRQCVVSRFDIGGGTPIICHLSGGSYVITGRSEEWLSATLSAQGQCTVGDTRPIELRNGRIDVKLP